MVIYTDQMAHSLKDALGNVADAIHDTFSTPSEMDSNFERANIVDGLFYIGRALHRIADAMEKKESD